MAACWIGVGSSYPSPDSGGQLRAQVEIGERTGRSVCVSVNGGFSWGCPRDGGRSKGPVILRRVGATGGIGANRNATCLGRHGAWHAAVRASTRNGWGRTTQDLPALSLGAQALHQIGQHVCTVRRRAGQDFGRNSGRTQSAGGAPVVDLSTNVASAFTTLLFADLGAEVISVERPGGSRIRELASWPYWLRGKRSVVLDLKDARQRDAALALAAGADVAVEAWGPGVAERLGVGDEVLRGANPALVYTSISGFGHNGPYDHLRAHEAVVMAKTGSMYGNTAPNRPGPVMTNPLGAMTSASLLAMQGTLLALHERVSSGFGQRVDATMVQGILAQDPWFYFLLELAQKWPDALRATPGPTMAGKRAVPPSWLSFGLLNGVTRDGRWLQFSHAISGSVRRVHEGPGSRPGVEGQGRRRRSRGA